MRAIQFGILVAAAGLAMADVTYDEATDEFTCSVPGAAYCGGPSLETDIIIRCDANGKGTPGRCSNNLAGEFPAGAKLARCWQKEGAIGIAACEKNCVVYGGSGSLDVTFTLPEDVCTPYANSTSGSHSGTLTTVTVTEEPTCTDAYTGDASDTATEDPTYSATYTRPSGSPIVTGTGTGTGTGAFPIPTNGTTASYPAGNATHTPPKPTRPLSTSTSTPSFVVTAGAAVRGSSAALAALGVLVACLL